MAIDTLRKANYDEKFMELCLGDEWYEETIKKAINACKEALEEPAQMSANESLEPVAWIKEVEVLYMKAHKADGIKNWKTNLGLKPEPDDVPLYTHPAPSWQGLSQHEINNIGVDCQENDDVDLWKFARAIEQALKEKNK